MAVEAGVPSNEFVVQLGQSFRVFDANKIKTNSKLVNDTPQIMDIVSRRDIRVPGLLSPLPFEMSAYRRYKNSAQAYTPFNIDLGYPVNSIEHEVVPERNPYSDIHEAPLLFEGCIRNDPYYTPELVLDHNRLTAESARILARLKLQLFFPNELAFEACVNMANSPKLSFGWDYRPINGDTLVVPDGNVLDEGLQIALPDNLDLLQQIKGRFTLSPQTP